MADFKLSTPFQNAAGQFDPGATLGFVLAVAGAVMLLRAVPFTAKLVK